MLCMRDLCICGSISGVDGSKLGGMDGPLAIKAHTSPHASIAQTGIQVTNSRSDAIDNSNTGSASSGNGLCLRIVVIEKLFATRLLSADISSIIEQAKDQTAYAGRTFGNLFGMKDGVSR